MNRLKKISDDPFHVERMDEYRVARRVLMADGGLKTEVRLDG